MSNRFSMYSASLSSSVGGVSVELSQMQSQTVTPGVTEALIRPGGMVDPAVFVSAFADAQVTFQTRDIKNLLASCPFATGRFYDQGATFRFQRRTDFGTFMTGGNHVTVTSPAGYLRIDGIEADTGSEEGATASCTYSAMSSTGFDAPLTATDQVDFVSATPPAFKDIYYLGPCYTSDGATPTLMNGLQSVNIQSGLGFGPLRQDGISFPVVGVIRTRDSVCDATFLRGNMPATDFTHLFKETLALEMQFYLRRGSTSTASGRYADGSAEHIIIAFSQVYWGADDWTVNAEDDATLGVMIKNSGSILQNTAAIIPQAAA